MISRRNLIGSVGTFSLFSKKMQAATRGGDETLSAPYLRYAKNISKASFGGAVSNDIRNYTRVAPYAACAGLLQKNALEEVKSLGFGLVIDLRGADESGVREEQAIANNIGLPYLNISVSARSPSWDQVKHFRAIIEQSKHYPVLIHCVTSNRAGAMWSMYRADAGIPPLVAIEEGRAAGLESREPAVRKMLNL